jgi:hypothetical protein
MGGRAKNRHVNTIANLLALCPDCHARIESQRAWAYQCGYLLYESDDPDVATVLVMGRRRVVLAETYEEV